MAPTIEENVGEAKRRKCEGQPLVLHLCGSQVSRYYEGVSAYYAGQCFNTVAEQKTYRHAIVEVNLDGSWSFPENFTDEARKAAPRMSLVQALARIQELNPDVALPQMFCLPGMTNFRALIDTLGIPMVGCVAAVMALSTNKAQSRAVVAAAGVRVPEAELLRGNDRPKMPPPFVLKPCNEDNSMGVSVFMGKEGDDLDQALRTAFQFDTEVLCERFIPLGREIRCAVIELEDGSLEMLPCLEYFLTEEHPIRASQDKLVTDENGVPVTVTQGGRQCPADIDPVLMEKLRRLACESHRALGCRDYSLYDVRVDPSGEPYFLEACLYCSFAPKSVIVGMWVAKGGQQQELFESFVNRAIKRRRQTDSSSQLLGMKAR